MFLAHLTVDVNSCQTYTQPDSIKYFPQKNSEISFRKKLSYQKKKLNSKKKYQIIKLFFTSDSNFNKNYLHNLLLFCSPTVNRFPFKFYTE